MFVSLGILVILLTLGVFYYLYSQQKATENMFWEYYLDLCSNLLEGKKMDDQGEPNEFILWARKKKVIHNGKETTAYNKLFELKSLVTDVPLEITKKTEMR